MPFLKSRSKKFRPTWLEASEKVIRNGFRIAAFGEKSTKEKFTGEFLRDMKHGKGIQRYVDGTVYLGDWSHGKRSGHGILSYDCGNGLKSRIYVGLWGNDKPNGFGMKFFPDGGLYRGDFRNGLRHGWGYMKYPNGFMYIGKWAKDQRHGAGRLTNTTSKTFYEGTFKKDTKCGRGMFHHTQTGQLQDGIWLADKARVTAVVDDKEREAAPKKTAYPIPPLYLGSAQKVYRLAAAEILDEVATF